MALYARLFSPESFGTIASISVFLVFFQLFSDMGIASALIGEKHVDSKLRDASFSITIIIAIFVSSMFYLFTFYLDRYYENNIYSTMGVYLAVSIFFETCTTVPRVGLQKETRFFSISLINSIVEVSSAIIVYILYVNRYGIESLFVRIAYSSFSRYILFYYASKLTSIGMPRLTKGLAPFKRIIGFSKYQFLFNFVNYFSRNLDNVLVAKYMGAASLGVYDRAYQLMRYPLMLITFAINPAIQPILSNKDVTVITQQHCKLVNILMSVSIPVALYFYFFSNQIVMILFGSNWLTVVPIIKMLSIIIPVQMVMSSSGSFFQSCNRTDLLFHSGFIAAALNVIAIIYGVHTGSLILLSTALCISFFINYFQIHFFLYKYCFSSSYINFINATFLPLLISLPSFIVFYFFKSEININNHFFMSFVGFIILAITFFLPIYICVKFLNKEASSLDESKI